MSRDNSPVVSSGDDLIGLYRHTGFVLGGTDPAPMIAYDGAFMDEFAPLDGWYMEFVVDIGDEIAEADETNNVLVVDADPAAYRGPLLPKGLPALSKPGPGGFSFREPSTWARTSVDLVSLKFLGSPVVVASNNKVTNHEYLQDLPFRGGKP